MQKKSKQNAKGMEKKCERNAKAKKCERNAKEMQNYMRRICQLGSCWDHFVNIYKTKEILPLLRGHKPGQGE